MASWARTNADASTIGNFSVVNNNSAFFKFKQRITSKTCNDGTKMLK